MSWSTTEFTEYNSWKENYANLVSIPDYIEGLNKAKTWAVDFFKDADTISFLNTYYQRNKTDINIKNLIENFCDMSEDLNVASPILGIKDTAKMWQFMFFLKGQNMQTLADKSGEIFEVAESNVFSNFGLNEDSGIDQNTITVFLNKYHYNKSNGNISVGEEGGTI